MLYEEVLNFRNCGVGGFVSETYGFSTSEALTQRLILLFHTHGIHLAHDVFLPSEYGGVVALGLSSKTAFHALQACTPLPSPVLKVIR